MDYYSNKTNIKPFFVFDIDGVLCTRNYDGMYDNNLLTNIDKTPSECPTMIFNYYDNYDCSSYPHIFLPHLNILFDYLINKGGKIFFFSSGIEARNFYVIGQLLLIIYGRNRLLELLLDKQFIIFSKQHLKAGCRRIGEGINIKDLRQILEQEFLRDIRKGATEKYKIDDIILIEDQVTFAEHTQLPVVRALDVEFWYASSEMHFLMNATYYLIGFFRYYFENDNYNYLCLRQGIEKIYNEHMLHEEKITSTLPEREDWALKKLYCKYKAPEKDDEFTKQMIADGIAHVRTTCPKAKLYVSNDGGRN
jgi:hypothetical protein